MQHRIERNGLKRFSQPELMQPLARSLITVCALAIVFATLAPKDVEAQGGTITLLGHLDLAAGATRNSDIWGWVDPVTQKEYAIVGEYLGPTVYIVDVSDPTQPSLTQTFNVPNMAFDLKTWGNYLYMVDGNGSGLDGQIYDISDPTTPVFVGVFPSAHNITIDDNGILYLEFGGLRIYDLNPDPTNPTPLKIVNTTDGHDATVIGNTLYDFHGTSGTFIYNVTDPSNPILLGSITDPTIVYHHSGWPSADGQYLYINDELANSPYADITVWDISNPAAPFKVDEYNDPNATIHNTYRIGNFLFASYYVAGFSVFDVSDPFQITLADSFDTSAFTGEGSYEGAWGCYPFAPSGNIYISDEQNGLYIFSFQPTPTGVRRAFSPAFALHQNHPNPFNPTTTIGYELRGAGVVKLDIFDATGRHIRNLVDGTEPAGYRSASWDGRDARGIAVASGVYFYTLQVNGSRETRQMVLLK